MTLLVLISLSSWQCRAEQPPLKVGVILSLSGPTAEYGEALRRGIQLGVAHYPEAKRKFQFIFEDAEYSPTKAVQAFHKLAELDKVDLVYVWGVSFCEAIAPLAERRRMPTVAQCISPTVSAKRRYVIRFMNQTNEYVDMLLSEIQARGWKRLGIVITENPYLEEMYNALKERASKNIQIELIDRYQIHQNDFRSTVAKLHQSRYDSIGVFLAAGQISKFYLQMREARLNMASFGSNFFDSYSELEMAGGAMDGAIFANNYVAPIFAAEYFGTYNDLSQVQWAALSYEFVKHLAGIKSLTRNSLIQDIARPPISSGALGAGRLITTNYSHAIEFPLVIKEVHGTDTLQR